MRLLDFAAPAAALAALFGTSLVHAQNVPPAPGQPGAAPAPAPYPAPPEQAPPAAAQPTAPVPVETAPAGAPPGPPPQQQEPTIYVAQPPLPPLYPRTRLRHDGFYLRLNGGFGYGSTTATSDGSSAEYNLHGGTYGLDVLIGGTPGTGLVVGGGLFLQGYIDPGTSREGESFVNLAKRDSDGVGLVMIGPFIDVFPNPYGGFHFGGTLALAGTSLQDRKDNPSGGFGLGIWAGYMGWVSSEWSVGGLVKVTGIWTGREVENDDAARKDVLDSSRAVQLMFSAAYH